MCCLLFFLVCCRSQIEQISTPNAANAIAEEKNIELAFKHVRELKVLVHSGDLVLRSGKDFTSELMKRLSTYDKTYSHCGIANWENDSLFVYHALGGEWNPDQKLRRDPFEFFCNPYENRGFGIFRYRINASQQDAIVRTAHKFYQAGIPFDMNFDLTTDDRMYCSEFVFKTIEQAALDSVHLKTTTINGIRFVAVDNLFLNPSCFEIKRMVFEKNK